MRRLVGVGCVLLLLGAAGLLGWAALRVARPAASADSTPAVPPLVTVTGAAPLPTVASAIACV